MNDERAPYDSMTRRSCSGSSTVDQSGKCNMDFDTITRDGKFAAGSTGTSESTMAMGVPSPRTPATGENVLPSQRITTTESQARSRIAVRTIASKTGCTFVGELLMTRRMSAVAVCRLSDSCVSLNSRTFSRAITACSANV